ncbi:thioredoxin family protein [Colwelliaceae bacterium 6471]
MSNIYRVAISLLVSVSLSGCAGDIQPMVSVPTGEMNETVLLAEHEKFNNSYQHFIVSDRQLAQVKAWPSDLVIDVFFGTWCHDSEREVPRLLKALASYPEIKVNLIALDTNKSEPAGRALTASVKYTPTFIVSRKGTELGRIVEAPVDDLVADISAMLALH